MRELNGHGINERLEFDPDLFSVERAFSRTWLARFYLGGVRPAFIRYFLHFEGLSGSFIRQKFPFEVCQLFLTFQDFGSESFPVTQFDINQARFLIPTRRFPTALPGTYSRTSFWTHQPARSLLFHYRHERNRI